jgi:exonuclease VII large subunit
VDREAVSYDERSAMSNLEQLIVDLKDTLQRQIAGLDQRMTERIAGLDQRMTERMDGLEHQNRNLERLVVEFKESLEREMREGFAKFEVRVENQDHRLERYGRMLGAGARWTAGTVDWAEKVDTALATKDKQIWELSERIRKLENGSKS